MRWALIESGIVANVIEQDAAPQIAGQWVVCANAGPGWGHDGCSFSAPAGVLAPVHELGWSAYDFYRRFTQAERIAIRRVAATDPALLDFMQTLEHAIGSGSRLLATDPDLVAALARLQTQPAGSPILTAERAATLIEP